MAERQGVWDAGLQPERTRLAWRRTTLTVVVGGLVGGRALGDVSGPLGLAAAAAARGVAGLLGVLARWRTRRVAAVLEAGGTLPGAGLLLVVAALPATCAVLAGVGVLL